MEVVVFSIIGMPAFYIGKLVTKEGSVVTLTEVMMGAVMQKDHGVELVKIPQATRESKISLDTALVGGLLITKPDTDLVRRYEADVIKLYSKLTLV